jgi:hypothetical protein
LARRVQAKDRVEFYKSQWYSDLSTATSTGRSFLVNGPAAMNLLFNADAPAPQSEKVWHKSTGLRVFFTMNTTVQPQTDYITMFVVRPKPAMRRYLQADGTFALTSGVHFTAGDAGIVGEGRRPGAMINKQLFDILHYKRFVLGTVVYTGQGPANITDTHKEFYFKVPVNRRYEAVQGTALTLTEAQMGVEDRVYVLVFTDRPEGTAVNQQPKISMNAVAVHSLVLN